MLCGTDLSICSSPAVHQVVGHTHLQTVRHDHRSNRQSEVATASPELKSRSRPPKVFRCPVCTELWNEKDFARHISNWVHKLDKDESVKSGMCPGVRDPNHPLLHRFPGDNLSERVQCLVRNIRSLVRPGAYDAMSSEGSGRHIDVDRRITFLLSRDGASGN